MNWKVRSSPTEKKTTTQANKDRNEVKREIMIAKKKRKRNQSTWLRAASISMALIRSEWVVRLGKNWRPWEHRSSNDSYVINVKSSSNPTGTGQRRATTTTATDDIVWVKKKTKENKNASQPSMPNNGRATRNTDRRLRESKKKNKKEPTYYSPGHFDEGQISIKKNFESTKQKEQQQQQQQKETR